MPSPTQWKSPFQINTNPSEYVYGRRTHIIGLANGNILVPRLVDANGAVLDSDILGAIYSPEGTLLNNSVQMNTTAISGTEMVPAIAATNDGGFVVVYRDRNLSYQAVWERYDENGTLVDSDTFLSTSIDHDEVVDPVRFHIAVNQLDNSFVITYWTESQELIARHVNSAGVTGEQFIADDGSIDSGPLADLAVLSNETYVSVYNSNGVRFRIFSENGSLVSTSTVTNNGAYNPEVASLANGNFVVVWDYRNDPTSPTTEDIRFRIYNSQGNPVSAIFSAASSNDAESRSSVVALPDGDFAIVWSNTSDGTLEARQFNANGTADSSKFIIDTIGEGTAQAGVSSDGRLLFSWVVDHPSGDIERANLFASIWDSRTSTINAADYEQNLSNFVDSDVVTARPTSSIVNGDGDSNQLFGRGGDDELNGFGEADTLRGRSGNDTLNGGDGIDQIISGTGNDRIRIQGNDAIDFVFGGSGLDTLDLGSALNRRVEIDLNTNFFGAFAADGSSTITEIGGIETVIGTPLDDEIVGDGAANRLEGRFGNDTLEGQGGFDTLVGGDGTDSVSGGAGTDTIIIRNKEQIDYVDGGGGLLDVLDLAGITSSDQAVSINLQTGSLQGLGPDTTITGIEKIIGTQADDTIIADGGSDTLEGRRGNDTLQGGAATDVIRGGLGDDRIVILDNEFFDHVYGDLGVDTLDLSDISTPGRNASVNLETNLLEGFGPDTTITTVENVIGTQGDDTLIGDAGANTLDGQAGNDTIQGGRGTDTILGGTGSDRIVILNNQQIDHVDGGAGIDALDLTGVTAFNQSVSLNLTTGLFQGFGADTTISNIEQVSATQASDVLIGAGQDDQFFGNGGKDNLVGNGGNDVLSGGISNDTLTGGAGSDLLVGGTGADRFTFVSAQDSGVGVGQRDTIADFNPMSDAIDLSAIDASPKRGNQVFKFIGMASYSGSAGELRYSQLAGNTIVGGDINGDAVDDFQIQVSGLVNLSAADFIL